METAAEHSALATVDPAVAKLSSVAETFPGLKGTIVHARADELWIVAADGSRRRRMKRPSTPPDPPTRAVWSPSGDALVFTTHQGDERGRLVMLGARCESARVLGPASGFERATFSADGQFIVSGANRLELASGEGTTVAGCAGSVSGDGRRCLVEDPARVGALRVAELGTENVVEVVPPSRATLDLSEVADVTWTHDGSTLWIVPRFRGSKTVAGGVTLYDWSPLYRVRLPKMLSPTKTKPIEPEYFRAGNTSSPRGPASTRSDGRPWSWRKLVEGSTLRPCALIDGSSRRA